MTTPAGGEAELERARLELRRLGYLDHGLERFLLQDALRPRQPLRTMALLALKVGLLAGGGERQRRVVAARPAGAVPAPVSPGGGGCRRRVPGARLGGAAGAALLPG